MNKQKINLWDIAVHAKNNFSDHHTLLKSLLLKKEISLDLDEEKLFKNFVNFIKIGEKNIKSQLYQDVFSAFVVDNGLDKTFLEFGATDGFKLSNTYMLENSLGWTGALCEPSPQWHIELKKNRPNSKILTKCIWKASNQKLDFFVSAIGELSTLDDFKLNEIDSMPGNTEVRIKKGEIVEVETISLNDVIEENFKGKSPSYISIDTEGSEYEILNAFNLKKYRPVVFTIEHNYTKNESGIDKIMKINDYKRVFRKLTAFDAWYVRNDILSGLI